MFSFSRNTTPASPAVNQAPSKSQEPHPLDALTGGAFSASTSGERAARIREWLTTEPAPEQLQEVFKELSARDKGAAKPLREKLDEIKRAKGQELLAAEWAEKAQGLLSSPRLNIADALAWQRDAAKAGAPLSREPLAALKLQLAERVRAIEDLQNQAMVQREAAVLLAQRIEVLSTKGWQDAQAALEVLRADVQHWQSQADVLVAEASWSSVDAKFPPQIEASRAQLLVVWEAFSAALAQAVLAAADATAALPPVPVWADELRAARGLPPAEAPAVPTGARTEKPARPKVDPELRARAAQAVGEALARLEQEVAEGHGKGSSGAAAALRNALKEHGRLIDDKLEAKVHAALASAGELEGWQRWRADQLREELVAKAEGLLLRTGKDGQPLPEGQAPQPRLGGRKMQETLRQLREQWKSTDQGGVPNHALWKRFDAACNEAHKVVEAWLDKLKQESAEHRAQRLALIEEVKAWGAANASASDWKAFHRALHQFSERWREAGHLSEKAFAELQPLWKEAIHAAAAPLEAAQKDSVARRQALIDEATRMGAAPALRVDAVKALQQRWQAEAQGVPLERKLEQKLWDAFRKPIDEAFNRKTEEREKAATQMSEHDRLVLEAARALEAANASGDVQRIRAAMAALDQALKGQAQAQAERSEPQPAAEAAPAPAETAGEAVAESTESDEPAAAASEAPAAKPAAKPVIAMRGDDRPGMKKAEPVVAGRGGARFGERKGAPGAGRFGDRREERGTRDGGRDGGRFGDRAEQRGPRLGDAAFRAQRDALEHAQAALRKLAAQAHGEALSQLIAAWEQRQSEQLPSQQELGRGVTPALRGAWVQALGAAPSGDAAEALLRLEMAAELPTPAEHLNARRALQLQLLTRRNDPAPAQTWGRDAATVLASGFDGANARRLQNALKVLLRN
ncbi:DUF349 domain-containing protein [Ramlibacter sp. 2FC]|uniref:DUF349 domain-containing protein n=1 Tax=Ramlibacter sp. 2FC TaxID=2502188 RepID=UPI0010F8BE92|nr:DUF349 domain-containing protein [Ramlibacter sp. 2FC]